MSRLSFLPKLATDRVFGSETLNQKFEKLLGGGHCATVDICPDLIICAIAAGAALGFIALFQGITMAGRKRRKRDIYQNYSQGSQHNICEQREKIPFF